MTCKLAIMSLRVLEKCLGKGMHTSVCVYMYVCVYVCMYVCPGGVVVRPWAHNREFKPGTCPSGDVV